ncbi:MAG: rhodanese-like domain-containing protein [Kofleriaceae bacterium]
MRIALALLLVAACSKSEPSRSEPSSAGAAHAAPAPTTSARASKDPAKAREMIASGAAVLDVRTTDEYAGDHLPQATNIPIQELSSRVAEVEKLTGGDKSKPLVVYCAAGGRAGKAKTQLEAQGYTNVVNGGGLDDLKP